MNSRRLMDSPQAKEDTLSHYWTAVVLCIAAKFGGSCLLWVISSHYRSATLAAGSPHSADIRSRLSIPGSEKYERKVARVASL
jgi:hypothetical protein